MQKVHSVDLGYVTSGQPVLPLPLPNHHFALLSFKLPDSESGELKQSSLAQQRSLARSLTNHLRLFGASRCQSGCATLAVITHHCGGRSTCACAWRVIDDAAVTSRSAERAARPISCDITDAPLSSVSCD